MQSLLNNVRDKLTVMQRDAAVRARTDARKLLDGRSAALKRVHRWERQIDDEFKLGVLGSSVPEPPYRADVEE